ncbi:methyltransferase [Streptomyces sp. NPDC001220]
MLKPLEPRLAPGTLVVGDASTLASGRPCLDCVRAPANGCRSGGLPVEDGLENSRLVTRLG